MKSNFYRLSLIFFLMLSLGLSGYFLYTFITVKDEINSQVLNCLATIVLMIVCIFEIIFLFIGMKNEKIIIHDLCYDGKTINKGFLIVDNVALGVTLITIIVLAIMTKFTPQNKLIYYFIINVGVFILINTTYYDLYFLLKHSEEKDDLNLIGRK